jgi:tetratricopeptide (TPR) repeat protein
MISCTLLLSLLSAQVSSSSSVARAETLAARARERCIQEPSEGIRDATLALAATSEFSPTSFVSTGRKGELVEDVFLTARSRYRRHRAALYRAMGECLARASQDEAATRYLMRALDLDPKGDRQALGTTLLRLKRAREALDLLLGPLVSADLSHPEASLQPAPGDQAVMQSAADALGLASLQAEIDRLRLDRLGSSSVRFREGPFRVPPQARLSTGEPFHLVGWQGLTLIYVSDATGRGISSDLEWISRAASNGIRVALTSAEPAADAILRRALRVYHREWPLVLGPSLPEYLALAPPCALIVGREGWAGAVVGSPLDASLLSALQVLARHDVMEIRPRRAWNGSPARREAGVQRPELSSEGLAPGEDLPYPPEFEEAVRAFRAGDYRAALRSFDLLEKSADGWMLAPEARYNRALCLKALGAREEARRLLLGIGDSRFQEAVDRALESPASVAPAATDGR